MTTGMRMNVLFGSRFIRLYGTIMLDAIETVGKRQEYNLYSNKEVKAVLFLTFGVIVVVEEEKSTGFLLIYDASHEQK